MTGRRILAAAKVDGVGRKAARREEREPLREHESSREIAVHEKHRRMNGLRRLLGELGERVDGERFLDALFTIQHMPTAQRPVHRSTRPAR